MAAAAQDGTNEFGQTPLALACRDGDLDAVRRLPSHHADLEKVNDFGWTALGETVVALTGKTAGIVDFLLLAKADPDGGKDLYGQTPLEMLMSNRSLRDPSTFSEQQSNEVKEVATSLILAGANCARYSSVVQRTANLELCLDSSCMVGKVLQSSFRIQLLKCMHDAMMHPQIHHPTDAIARKAVLLHKLDWTRKNHRHHPLIVRRILTCLLILRTSTSATDLFSMVGHNIFEMIVTDVSKLEVVSSAD